jgi:hypothetical protein
MPKSRSRLYSSCTIPVLLALMLGAMAPSPSYGQSASEGSQTPASSRLAASPIPLTYDPSAAKKTAAARKPGLGRTVVIAFGSLPFTVFYTDFIFDSVRFATNGFDLQYAPWPLKNAYSAAVSSSERFLRLGVSLGLSAAIGIIDLILYPGT